MAPGLPVEPYGLPVEPYTRGIDKLEAELPALFTGASSGGLPLNAGPGRVLSPGGNLVNLPGQREIEANRARDAAITDKEDRFTAMALGLASGEPAAGFNYLNQVRSARRLEAIEERKAANEQVKMQIELWKAASTGRLQLAQEAKAWGEALEKLAPDLATASPDQREAFKKSLKFDAAKTSIPTFLSSMADLATEQPDVGRLFPHFMPFVDRQMLPVFGPRLKREGREGRAENVMWEWAAGNVSREVRSRAEEILPSLREAAGDKPVPYTTAVKAITRGNLVLAKFINGDVPEDQRKIIEGARQGVRALLTQYGVILPEVTAAATAAGAKTEAEERARLAPDIAAGKVAQAEKIGEATERGQKRAALDPAVVRLEALRAATLKEVEQTIQEKYEGPKRAQATTQSLRNDFLALPSVRVLQQALGAYGQMAEIFKGPHTTASDWSLIVGYAKINDPDSVAREGEQKTVSGLASVDDRIANAYDLFLKKKLLTDDVRRDIMDGARLLVLSRVESHKDIEKEFHGIAGRQGASARDAVPDLLGRFRDGLKETPRPKADILSKKDARYRAARGRGLTDTQIEQRFNIKLTD